MTTKRRCIYGGVGIQPEWIDWMCMSLDPDYQRPTAANDAAVRRTMQGEPAVHAAMKVGRPRRASQVWPWQDLELGHGFSIPAAWAGSYMRSPDFLRVMASRFGIKVSIARRPEGVTVTRVA